MSRKKATVRQETPNSPAAKPEEPVNNIRVIREYVESLVIALGLAFFFKAFAAEAFVIPTGSMAATLMGRHKDVHCESCGFPFQISASEESNDGSERPRDSSRMPVVLAGTCPQCRWTMYVGPDNFEKKTFLSFNGDRIFVNKSQFDFREPKRWHVTVFRYPGRAQINYIKRLVGQENETVRLQHGDVFVKKDGEENFEIQRKPLRALQAMLRPVDDNDYVRPDLHEIGWPTRWFDDTKQWTRAEDFKSFRIDSADASDAVWLNFRNVVPSCEDWFYLIQGQIPPQGVGENPQLITDFLGYNSGIVGFPDRYGNIDSGSAVTVREIQRDGKTRKQHFCATGPNEMGLNWVGDLALSCRLNVEKPEGLFLLRLVKGGREFLCGIDLSNGMATFSIPGLTDFQPESAETPIRVAGAFDLMFSNIDEELRLIVDGREIDFGLSGRYDRYCEPGGPMPRDRSPNRLDLVPASLGVQNASVSVEHLKVQRDMYYIACDEYTDTPVGRQCDLISPPFRDEYGFSERTVNRVLSTPEEWTNFGKTRSVTFELGAGEYLMLGDNSAKSKDSRLWTTDGVPHHVPRDLLIGEAVFVYWPHGKRIPGTRLALIPNFRKVRFID